MRLVRAELQILTSVGMSTRANCSLNSGDDPVSSPTMASPDKAMLQSNGRFSVRDSINGWPCVNNKTRTCSKHTLSCLRIVSTDKNRTFFYKNNQIKSKKCNLCRIAVV